MNHIVLGYDDTEASKRALERAAELTKALKARLTVTSVVPIAVSSGRSSGPIDPAESPAKHADEARHARQYLEGLGIEAEYQGAIGEPSEALVEVARERGADLIVVGTRELGALARLLGQSVSDSVAHKAHCDVLIVH
jgi:nucleotide-binding universal stress UspA family protein